MPILTIAQFTFSVALIVLVLFQQRGAALGSVFGGEGTSFATRRGLEKKIFWATIICGFSFIVSSVLNLVF